MGRLKELYPCAFVSGASAGLGLAFAKMLLAEGVRVWGTSRDVGRLDGLAREYPAAFVPVALDLADGDAASRAFSSALEGAGGAIDLLVNNAGYGVFGEFAVVESGEWRAQIECMLGTVLGLSQSALRGMAGRGRGCIVHVSSLAAEFPLPYMSGYNVSKAGLSALSESLMFETRGTGIRVIDFRPGDYRTDFNRAMRKQSNSEAAGRAWAALEAALASAPAPELAARDLRRALLRGKSGIVRSGSFFQAGVAPALARFLPMSWRRWAIARYFEA